MFDVINETRKFLLETLCCVNEQSGGSYDHGELETVNGILDALKDCDAIESKHSKEAATPASAK